MFRSLSALALVTLFAACQTGAPQPEVRRADTVAPALAHVPADACWATDRVPALTETQFVATGPDGARAPQDVVLRPAEERLFAVPCPAQMDAGFTETLQRALSARGLYTGAITGEMDAQTSDAVRRFQAPQGLNSAILSLEGAQQLGLVTLPRAAL
ncbi:peptidoglycan-binding domain-containing protein [Pararhodobacter oceanensis]|uniref:Peptidoglycan-binding protein n=1 Tax=Pararhodobacter oceanensis TaxID=2172121 RepID=A0A2T8HWG4_9RHOB|nr:peptidoglycan-binding domain-containing protein [Pararhodobacter oceanensis]PVH29776.1 peptidoglycan-binding protein [Pararhodobacter oceanensis]